MNGKNSCFTYAYSDVSDFEILYVLVWIRIKCQKAKLFFFLFSILLYYGFSDRVKKEEKIVCF